MQPVDNTASSGEEKDKKKIDESMGSGLLDEAVMFEKQLHL